MLPAAINFEVTAVEIKEIVYQAVAYLGIGRVFPFLKAMNLFFEEVNISLTLASQSNTKVEDRLKAGEEAQIAIFGESMRGFSNQGSDESQHINQWLVENCFGDYYTRSGSDYRKRELITLPVVLVNFKNRK